jgi:DNA-binding response OmpR family regulator
MLRRPHTAPGTVADEAPAAQQFGDLVIDEGRHEVTRRGAVLSLTAREFALLSMLARQPGRVYTRSQLLEQVWGEAFYEEHIVDVHIANLRKKLEDDPARPRYIETVRGVGYRFGPRFS